MDDADVASPLPPFQTAGSQAAFRSADIIAPRPFFPSAADGAKNASPREPSSDGFVSLAFGFFENLWDFVFSFSPASN
ncbi:hypothetical protein [Sphingobium sp. EM0848]|uniref:hypothetical protein n=1 Tax=Sphingobium sp. EM0848 TaxID=2743473 RepID=UPI00159C7B03|nr:hypothetical protein [Sphingobium sp. EM0848]